MMEVDVTSADTCRRCQGGCRSGLCPSTAGESKAVRMEVHLNVTLVGDVAARCWST